MYFADLLRIVAMSRLPPDTRIPMLHDFLAPPRREETGEEIKARVLARLQ